MLEHRRDRLRIGVAVAVLLCLIYLAGFGVYCWRGGSSAAASAVPAEVRLFWEVWDHVDRHFFGQMPSAEARTYEAIRRSLRLLDPYTVFVEPIARELEEDRLRGAYGGIGVSVWLNDQGQMTLAPYPDTPAQRAGLVRGDVLLAIEGEPLLEALTAGDVEVRLRGEVGTTVELTISRSPGPSFTVTIERERIEVPSLTWRMETPDTGYVGITRFTERTDDELDAALRQLSEAGASRLVLDLRGNGGGLLSPAVAVAGRFLQRGDVVFYQESHTAGDGGRRTETFRAEREGDLSTPVVVLVDGGTASAAEIVSGALQDHERAPLMGESTFGKGSVQEIFSLSDGSSLHVTSAVWLTPDRHRIDEQGLTPDIVVSAGKGPGDEPLRQAVDYLESE